MSNTNPEFKNDSLKVLESLESIEEKLNNLNTKIKSKKEDDLKSELLKNGVDLLDELLNKNLISAETIKNILDISDITLFKDADDEIKIKIENIVSDLKNTSTISETKTKIKNFKKDLETFCEEINTNKILLSEIKETINNLNSISKNKKLLEIIPKLILEDPKKNNNEHNAKSQKAFSGPLLLGFGLMLIISLSPMLFNINIFNNKMELYEILIRVSIYITLLAPVYLAICWFTYDTWKNRKTSKLRIMESFRKEALTNNLIILLYLSESIHDKEKSDELKSRLYDQLL